MDKKQTLLCKSVCFFEGKGFLSFVGAMKIARNVTVFGRYNEWYAPLPAPSLRELSSDSETEGVSSVEW